MTSINKIFAFLSYLLLIPGWLFVMIFRRKHPSELGHARQSMVITLMPLIGLVFWFVLAWVAFVIPTFGSLLAWFGFAILIAVGIFLVILWFMGMIRALRGDEKPLAVVGNWAARLPF
jgi:uncharacterized membrane protein